MGNKENSRSDYFQSIARYFFKQRGAPFFLSSKELDLVVLWEEMEIPLPVVLEGIKSSLESYRQKPGKKDRIQSLAFCNNHVLRAFEQYRERKVGFKEWLGDRNKKKEQAKTEIKKFLEKIPPKITYLKKAYLRAQTILSQSYFNEEKLEQIEGEVEELLWQNAPDGEKAKVKKEILAGYKFKEEEFKRIFKVKLVKVLRDKYKIPYISLYYY